MTSAVALDPRFPNLRPDVVAGYLNAPEHIRAQVIDGELLLLPSPRRQHAFTATELLGELYAPFSRARGGPGGWLFLAIPELHLGARPDIVIPDIAGWRRDRLPDGFMHVDAPAAIELAPDWICEVISESTRQIDVGKKRRIWRREGVSHLWHLSPESRTLEVWRLENGRWSEVDTFEGDSVVRAEPFDAIELDLTTLWPAQTAP